MKGQTDVRGMGGQDASLVQIKRMVADEAVRHFVAAGADLANPSDPLARIRREVLRGLRA